MELMPLVTDIATLATTAGSFGADAKAVANTYPAMAIGFRNGISKLGNLTVGLSGRVTKPIRLRPVWEVKKAVEIPTVSLGRSRRQKTCSILSVLASRPYRSGWPVSLSGGPVRPQSRVCGPWYD